MKKGIIVIAAVCLSAVGAFAQKLGHINGQSLVEHMPEYKTAYEELNAYKQQYETALQAMQTEYEKMIQEFEAVRETAPKVILETKAKDIEMKRQGIYDFQEQASADVSNEELKKIDPILKKAKDAIEKVGKANNFTYIFDSGTGNLLYMGGEDVTKLVCTELGIPDYSNEVKPTTTGGN
ncbi:MAG: OmpH family outer membrane protein [Flavobacteriales bacterium]|nr:OmpH family outer membrane protein [Flavobacteriales bacterium]